MNIAYVVVALGIAVSLLIFPFVLYYGDRIMVVKSDSMLPTLKPYDMIVVKPAAIKEIKVGDIIAFNAHLGDIDIIAHRVVGIVDDDGEPALKTKGDNVSEIDEWRVHDQDLIGKVVSSSPSIGILLIDPVRYAIITFIVMLSFSILWMLSRKHKVSEKSQN